MLGKELAMTGKIAHVAERKGFERALNGVSLDHEETVKIY